jgi:hypothetical protein
VPRWDLVSTSLFLHHFQGRQLDALLQGIARSSHVFLPANPTAAGWRWQAATWWARWAPMR